MGLNIVIGCTTHQEKIWFYRGRLEGFESFYREHWTCSGLAVTDDQADFYGVMDDYEDVGEQHGAWRIPEGALSMHRRKGAK